MRRHTSKVLRAAISLVTLAALGLAGCGQPAKLPAAPRAGPPPLRVSYRKSNVPGQGLVAGVNNKSATEPIKLVAVFVRGKGEKEERSYRIDKEIQPLDSITVGWLEFDGWKLKAGDKLRLLCEGYTGEIECDVTD